MPKFQYAAINPKGNYISGIISAQDSNDAYLKVCNPKLNNIQVKPYIPENKPSPFLPFKEKDCLIFHVYNKNKLVGYVISVLYRDMIFVGWSRCLTKPGPKAIEIFGPDKFSKYEGFREAIRKINLKINTGYNEVNVPVDSMNFQFVICEDKHLPYDVEKTIRSAEFISRSIKYFFKKG